MYTFLNAGSTNPYVYWEIYENGCSDLPQSYYRGLSQTLFEKGFESSELIGDHTKDFFPKYVNIRTLDPALNNIHNYIQLTEKHFEKNSRNMVQGKIHEFQQELKKAYDELEKLKIVIINIIDLYPNFPRDQLAMRESKISSCIARISNLNWTSIHVISLLNKRYT